MRKAAATKHNLDADGAREYESSVRQLAGSIGGQSASASTKAKLYFGNRPACPKCQQDVQTLYSSGHHGEYRYRCKNVKCGHVFKALPLGKSYNKSK